MTRGLREPDLSSRAATLQAHSARDAESITRLIRAQADMMQLLTITSRLALPDWFLGAGFVRDAVWDAMHGRAPSCARLRDLDLAYFDDARRDPARDRALEQELATASPDIAWDVKNQARMAARNGDAPYRDCTDAISQWPETATAIGVRLEHGGLLLCAPHGVSDLLGMIVRPTPRFREKLDRHHARMREKDWATRWPKLTFTT